MVVVALRSWSSRRWSTAVVASLATALVIGLPTDVIPNPVFGRPVPVTWWSPLVLAVSAVLTGMLVATYVRAVPGVDRPARAGGLGGALAFFAVGCPVCNKLVVVALGTSGALRWFEPIQPLLAGASVALLAVALRARLRGEVACPVPR